ncbi:MAG: PEP-CTERM sorting domain-containing protein [Pseudomonadota bacterium]
MKKLSNLIACLLALIFPHSTFAIIMEGTFSGNMASLDGYNMDVTPDAKFWLPENAHQPFTGTFWYDTELAGPPDIELNENFSNAQYIQERDWVHVTLVAANGASLETHSQGNLPSFSQHPTDSITIVRQHGFGLSYDLLTMGSDDWTEGSYRHGSLTAKANYPIFDGLGLVQNFQISSEIEPTAFASVGFDTRGVLNGVDYFGTFYTQLDKFEIHAREPASVPEPSSLLIFLGPLFLLFWRVGLLPTWTIKNKMKKTLAIAISMFVAGQAMASPISYDEAVDGDLIYGESLLNLGAGTNRVQGTITWSNNFKVDTDFDSFDFIVAEGSALTSISLDMSLQDVESGTWSTVGWFLDTGTEYLSQSTSFPTISQVLFNSAMPVSAGSFDMRQDSFSGELHLGEYRVADYTLTLNVASVPEPAYFVLLGIGLAGIGFSRKRKAA